MRTCGICKLITNMLCRFPTCAVLDIVTPSGIDFLLRQEWQRLCKQPGESCEQHDARLEAAGLSFRTCTIQPREAVWEGVQQMLGVSPSEAWKIASASGHGSIGGSIARPLERSGAGVYLASLARQHLAQ